MTLSLCFTGQHGPKASIAALGLQPVSSQAFGSGGGAGTGKQKRKIDDAALGEDFQNSAMDEDDIDDEEAEPIQMQNYPGYIIPFTYMSKNYLKPDQVMVIVQLPFGAANVSARVVETGYEVIVLYSWCPDMLDITKLLATDGVLDTPFHPLHSSTEAAIEANTTDMVGGDPPQAMISVKLPFAVEAAPDRMRVAHEELTAGGCVVVKIRVQKKALSHDKPVKAMPLVRAPAAAAPAERGAGDP